MYASSEVICWNKIRPGETYFLLIETEKVSHEKTFAH